MESDNNGFFIPKRFWSDKRLSLRQKIFLAEINRLDSGNGFERSNEWFSDRFFMSKDNVINILRELKDKGFIDVTYESKKNNKGRKIHFLD